MKYLSGLSGSVHSAPTYTTCTPTHSHSAASIRADIQHKSTENRTAFLPIRPEDVLDPGDGAAGVFAAGGGASGWSSAADQSLHSFFFLLHIVSCVILKLRNPTHNTAIHAVSLIQHYSSL